ncbi:hypothetical protein BASA81_006449 [Batrachochytrium salamandrivorans]|nr:hypothetical protein BASA81_006449 [Batrachochytrium salamandrivorans]
MMLSPPPGFDDDDKEVVVVPTRLPPGLIPPPPGLPPPAPREVAELREFLQWKDAKLAEKTELLLEKFSIHDVAEAIRDRFGMLPQGWRERGFTQSNQIRQRVASQTGSELKLVSKTDRKINEILDTERHFLQCLTEVQQKYLDRLYEIFGSENVDAIKNLGLTQEEANQIFEQLPQICRFSQSLLERLEIVDLIRTPPETGEDATDKLHSMPPSSTKKQRAMDFLKLWERCMQNNELLHHQQLIDVLITPMQRIPRYKLLLENLTKDHDPISCPELFQALELYTSAAKNMNDAMKSHEKLRGFFGSDEGLKPLTSTGSSNHEQGQVKIINQYTHRFLGH